jgi:hypothetical protein
MWRGAGRRPTRAAAGIPASVWQEDAYKITGRNDVAANLASITEPATLEEALSSPDADLWRRAMDEEMASLLANNTWTLERRRRASLHPREMGVQDQARRDGNIERYKARLVAKGFRQREGIDYDEVFAPVSKYATLRTLPAVAAAEDLDLDQLDIKTAFLERRAGGGRVRASSHLATERAAASTSCHLPPGALTGSSRRARLGTCASRGGAWRPWASSESEADPGLFIRRPGGDAGRHPHLRGRPHHGHTWYGTATEIKQRLMSILTPETWARQPFSWA